MQLFLKFYVSYSSAAKHSELSREFTALGGAIPSILQSTSRQHSCKAAHVVYCAVVASHLRSYRQGSTVWDLTGFMHLIMASEQAVAQ